MADQSTGPGKIVAKDQYGRITDTINLDAVLSENHSIENEITDHPVETGSNISDHSRPKPRVLSIEAVISNTPLSYDQQNRVVRSGAVQFSTTASRSQPQNAPGYAETAFAKLEDFSNKGTVVSIYTSLKTYESMEIENVKITRSASKAECLWFNLTAKQVRFVQNKTTRTVVAKDTRAGSKVKTGSQTMTTLEPAKTTTLNDTFARIAR